MSYTKLQFPPWPLIRLHSTFAIEALLPKRRQTAQAQSRTIVDLARNKKVSIAVQFALHVSKCKCEEFAIRFLPAPQIRSSLSKSATVLPHRDKHNCVPGRPRYSAFTLLLSTLVACRTSPLAKSNRSSRRIHLFWQCPWSRKESHACDSGKHCNGPNRTGYSDTSVAMSHVRLATLIDQNRRPYQGKWMLVGYPV